MKVKPIRLAIRKTKAKAKGLIQVTLSCGHYRYLRYKRTPNLLSVGDSFECNTCPKIEV
jgi:hypothetical protein